MNKSNFRAISTIVEKLNWQKMPAEVACSAIMLMVHNYQSGLADCCDEYVSEDTAIELLTYLDADSLWTNLVIKDYETLSDEALSSFMLYYRYDIERWMKLGEPFEDAIREWDIPSLEYHRKRLFCDDLGIDPYELHNIIAFWDKVYDPYDFHLNN